MLIKAIRMVTALGVASLLSACTTGQDGRPMFGWGDNFGEANRQTMAAQIIEPNPVYDSPVPATSGEHAAQAIARYRADKVKKPQPLTTSTLSGTSAGSSVSNGQ